MASNPPDEPNKSRNPDELKRHFSHDKGLPEFLPHDYPREIDHLDQRDEAHDSFRKEHHKPGSPSAAHPRLSIKNLLFLALILAAAGGAYFFWQHTRPKKLAEEPTNEAAKIVVIPVVSKTLFREDELPGEINAYQDVLIYPKIPGFIQTLNVDRGSIVKENELIATIYAPEYIAKRNEALSRVAAAKASLAAEQSNLEEMQALLKKREAELMADQSTYQRVNAASMAPGVIADNDVIQWAQNVEIDRQDVNALIKRVNVKAHEVELRNQEFGARGKAYGNFATFSSYIEVRSPFNGYITERKLHVGSFVGPNGKGAYPPICRIQQLNVLRIVAPVPERESSGVVPGSDVEFAVSAFPGHRFKGTVARLSNSLDKETRTMPVELNYFNPDYKVLPGMFCRVYWPTRRHGNSLFVPNSAVVTTPMETFVCKVDNGVVEWISVRTGESMNGNVEIFGEKIRAGDMVAKEASEELRNQSKVRMSRAKVPA